MRTKTKQFDLRPIARIAKKHARKSDQVGLFGFSEGYQIIRTCFAEKVHLRFNPETHGSSYHAKPRPESIAKGERIIAAIAQELREAGFEVLNLDNLSIAINDNQ